jgi:ABC-type lipoprotein release transport system permease subunit
LQYTTYELNEFGLPVETGTTESTVNYAGRHQWVPGITSIEASSAIVIGESSYRELVGDQIVDSHTSSIWMFELCDETNTDCAKALELLSADIKSNSGVVSASDWSTAHEENERNGGLIFGTPGLLSMMFVVAALASISSAFVFLSLVLSQRKRELAILQAIGASPNQVIRLVLFEIMSILLVSMVLGVTLGLAVSESFNGFFTVFGFIFQLFLGQSNPIDRDLVWPWFEIIAVNGLVLIAVIISLLFTTRRALDSDLATVLKGE